MRRILLIVFLLMLSGCQDVEQLISRLRRLQEPSPQPQPSSQPSVSASPTSQSTATAEMEEQIVQRINEIRQQQGLSALHLNSELAEVARNYSRKMAEQNFFSHDSPEGDRVGERVQKAGIFYLLVGENLFKSTNIPQPVPDAVQGWMDSPGHRENILRPEYRETGVGIWQQGSSFYITQLFLQPFF